LSGTVNLSPIAYGAVLVPFEEVVVVGAAVVVVAGFAVLAGADAVVPGPLVAAALSFAAAVVLVLAVLDPHAAATRAEATATAAIVRFGFMAGRYQSARRPIRPVGHQAP